ncbi:LVIVD repeat-containing protein [Cesiribacter sp. SM1]|uniref:LVIVD repeat-containing protein n=1 Tax=Cesiribacter sp. SM1 TaxID=2861196 RepID=UPI001CD33B7D|nr:hypothetical protein [Cesiribacter sp. SM1]
MNNIYFPGIRPWSLLLALLAFCITACDDKVEYTRVYTVYEPVYTSPEEIRASFAVEETPRILHDPGKIYIYGDYLFINEPGEGIHVVNNTDKANPMNIKFISIPGNFDMAAKDGALYIDSYMDLLVLDIRDIHNISITSRTENIFANAMTAGTYDPQRGIVTDWEEREKIEVSSGDFNGNFPYYFPYGGVFYAAMDASSLPRSSTAPTQSTTGIGGSMARFTIAGDYLYTIDNSNLYTFNIQNPETPTQGTTVQIGWGIETVFPYNGNLFIGAQNGMHIFSLQNPQAPRRRSTFSHVVSCDPVVVHDTLAYVTLRGGTTCRGVVNQLDIINIKNLEAPELLVSHPMQSPYGLAYEDGLLFICEGEHGLKVYDVSDIYKVNTSLLDHETGIDAYDVIPYQDVLIMIGREGLYQYDYSDPTDLKLLSRLTIERTKPIN